MAQGLIDLRQRSGKKPPAGQQRLFGPRAPREPDKRPMPLRVRRRRVRVLIALAALILIGSVAYGVSYLSYLPQYNIAEIHVEGAQEIAVEPVKMLAQATLADGAYHFISRSNIFLYPRAAIEDAVKNAFPRIRSAHVSRASLLATALTVQVEERQPFALWCPPAQEAAECYVMDEDGFIFATRASTSERTQYVFSGGLPAQAGLASSSSPIGQWFARAHLPGLIALLHSLGQTGFEPAGASIEGRQDFFIPLRDGFYIKASFGQEATTLSKNLELVLSSDTLKGKQGELEYVDLRFGNRVYYKLFSEGESAFGGKGQAESAAE